MSTFYCITAILIFFVVITILFLAALDEEKHNK